MNATTIWKFPLRVENRIELEMPAGARVLCVQAQQEQPCLWAFVDPVRPKEKRVFTLRGTGHPIKPGAEACYVGTFQLADGALVFHLFEGDWA